MRSGKPPHTKRLQASKSSELWCCCMEATERSLHVATQMGRELLTSKGDARQGVRVSQVVGSLQKTTQHGWKRWQTLQNVFDGSVPRPIWTISYMKWNHQRRMVSRGPHIPKRSLKAAIQGMIPALSMTGALWYTCLKPSPCLPELNAFGWEQKNKCAGNRRTPHIQRKSQHFLFSFPLLSPSCFPALPTSVPLCLAFPLSRNPVIFASSMFVHFCGFREIRCFQCTVYGSWEHSKTWAYLGIWEHVSAY